MALRRPKQRRQMRQPPPPAPPPRTSPPPPIRRAVTLASLHPFGECVIEPSQMHFAASDELLSGDDVKDLWTAHSTLHQVVTAPFRRPTSGGHVRHFLRASR